MQLLLEEFFKKIFVHINGIPIFPIKWAIKILFYLLILIAIGLIILSFYIGYQHIFLIILGIKGTF